MPLPEWRSVYLTPNGDGTGDHSANGDYLTTPTDFSYAPTGKETFLAKQLLVTIGDGGAQWLPNRYGAIPALDPGIRVSIQDAQGEILQRLDRGRRLVCNACWVSRGAYGIYSTTGNADDYLTVLWDFKETGGVYLPLTANQRLVLSLADDLSELSAHWFGLNGFVPAMSRRRHGWDGVGHQYLD